MKRFALILLMLPAACAPAAYTYSDAIVPEAQDFRDLSPVETVLPKSELGASYINGNGETCVKQGGNASICEVEGEVISVSDVISGSI